MNNRKYPPLLLSLISILLLSGCAQTGNHITAYANASKEVSEQALAGYQQIDETCVQRKISEVASDPTLLPDATTFQGPLTDKPGMAVRMEALKHLNAYAVALGQLSSAETRTDIDSASKELYGSLTSLSATYQKATSSKLPLSDENLALISTAIDAIGNVVVEAKRRSAIKTIVIQADPAVQKVASLLAQELPEYGTYAQTNLSVIETDLTRSYKDRAAKMTYEQRVKAIGEIRSAHEQVEAAVPFFNNLGKTASKMGQAHATLRKAVEQNKFTTRELVKEIGELAAQAQQIKKFHASLTQS